MPEPRRIFSFSVREEADRAEIEELIVLCIKEGRNFSQLIVNKAKDLLQELKEEVTNGK
ncbi:MAG: hypothetical protein R3240_00035 [Gammaproteobacteria bacterium]|nr:hypothetical protein [Gammaproteobacteria bacterium]